MFDQYLEKYKHVSTETFSYTQKSSFDERKEFILDSSACIGQIAEVLKKLPSDSGNLKLIYGRILRFIKEMNIPVQQINYEVENRKL